MCLKGISWIREMQCFLKKHKNLVGRTAWTILGTGFDKLTETDQLVKD